MHRNQALLHTTAAFVTLLFQFGASAITAPLQLEPSQPFPTEHVLRPALRPAEDHNMLSIGRSVNVCLDPLDGSPRVIEGADFSGITPVDRATDLQSLDKSCKAFIQSQFDQLKVNVDALKLHRDATLVDPEDQFLKYQVFHDNQLVYDAEVNCRFKKGILVQFTNFTFPHAKPRAKTMTHPVGLQQLGNAEFRLGKALDDQWRIAAEPNGYAMVPVRRYAVQKGWQKFVASIDLASGAVFELKSEVHFLNQPGRAVTSYYERNYQNIVAASVLRNAKLSIGSQSVTTNQEGAFSAPAGSPPTLKGFEGAVVKVAVKSGSIVSAEGQQSGDGWLVDYFPDPAASKESDKNMAQSMIYFHVNRIVQFARQFIQPAWFDRTLTANANLTQTCNAHWDGSTINFYSAGSGCANTGLISDVIYHEWGHGLDANTGGIADGAFSEGFSDIMSLLFTRSSTMAPGFKTDGSGIRDLAPNKVYPRDRGGVHAEGLIIGGTFFDMYEMLATKVGTKRAIETLAKFAFKGIYAATRYTDMYDALKVIDDDDANPATLSPNYCIMNKAFTDHGLATADSRCSS
jgi:hypothetical protein